MALPLPLLMNMVIAGGPAAEVAAAASPLAPVTLSAAELGTEVALELRCNEAYASVRHFESTHCLNMAAMSHAYVARRRELAAFMARVASALALPEEVAADALLLLDRVMSAPASTQQALGVERESQQMAAAVVAIAMAASSTASSALSQASAGSGGPGGAGVAGGSSAAAQAAQAGSLENLSQVVGMTLTELRATETAMRAALNGDAGAISGVRCLRLYLLRLGAVVDDDPDVPARLVLPDGMFSLISEAVLDPEFLNYRPSIAAAAALYSERLRLGQLPLWPSVLTALTGYDVARTPELAAAVHGMQRVYQERMVRAQMPAAMQAAAAAGQMPNQQSVAAIAAAAGLPPGAIPGLL